MDAFDEGIVSTSNFAQARQIIMARARVSKDKKNFPDDYSVDQLKQDISDATQVKSSYVREAKSKESRFLTLLTEINAVWHDQEFVKLLRAERLAERPDLAGDFNYETTTT